MSNISKININNTEYNLKDGRLPDLNNSTTQFLRGDGTWVAPTVTELKDNAEVSDEGTYLLIEQLNNVDDPKLVFIDYDGTVLYSYTYERAMALTALPANPTHSGLTSQGWNWTLAQIKTQLTSTSIQTVYVGQMYVTTNGNTEIDIDLDDSNRLSPCLYLAVNGTLTIDWGDNTATTTVTGSSTSSGQKTNAHTYSTTGKYTISIHVVSGSFAFHGSSSNTVLQDASQSSADTAAVYCGKIQHIRFGTGITTMDQYGLSRCYSLRSVTIPNTITTFNTYSFAYCYRLSSITIPYGPTSVSSYSFYKDCNLISISIPTSVVLLNSNSFQYCSSLRNVTFPSSLRTVGQYSFYATAVSCLAMTNASDSIVVGELSFYACKNLSTIILPPTIKLTKVYEGSFRECTALFSFRVPNQATLIENHCFRDDYALQSVIMPNTITSIGKYAFANCYSLKSINLSTSLTTIGECTFNNCHSLTEVTVPATVTTINANAFTGCSTMKKMHFLSTTPPTLGSTVFSGIPSDCVIYVPSANVETYKTVSGWSSYASQIQGE